MPRAAKDIMNAAKSLLKKKKKKSIPENSQSGGTYSKIRATIGSVPIM